MEQSTGVKITTNDASETIIIGAADPSDSSEQSERSEPALTTTAEPAVKAKGGK